MELTPYVSDEEQEEIEDVADSENYDEGEFETWNGIKYREARKFLKKA